MNRDESLFDQAVKRLDRAIALVEQKIAAGSPLAAAAESEHKRLAEQLTHELALSRARERELEIAGAEASAALAKAIDEINAALEPQGEDA
ncbi:MAG: hypothetical protein CGW95_00710 [Phenylobacterium zucineum]|nr:MAG: hypothetical protein CGW95_00710 [Phenylobacterium zucineum]